MANASAFKTTLPPLPSYTIEPMPDLLAWPNDFWLSLMFPVIVYWAMSAFFHVIDLLDLFPQYRLHISEDITSRNHASRYEVARDVILQQVIQVTTSAVLQLSDSPEYIGKEEYDIAVWASRIRVAQRAFPTVLGVIGLDALAISQKMAASHPLVAGAFAGGYYPSLTVAGVFTFAGWEIAVAKATYHFLIPAIQFFVATFVLDTWQYFFHRLMHKNRWMYTTFHSRHHRLHVPYAYGALYNHPMEGFLLDTLGAGIAFKLTSMTMRQGMCFFTLSNVKTVDDHSGYAFPWDPFQLVTNNNAAYHDIHHQSWGIKSNFSQPFFTFWDSLLDTQYRGPRTDRLADKKRRRKAQ